MLILIVCSVLFIVGIILAIYEYSKREMKDIKVDDYPAKYEKRMKQSYLGIIVIVASILIPLFFGMYFYFPNLQAKAYMESFYHTNASAYQITVDKTASYLSQEIFTSKLIAGNIEKAELSTSISDRIAEWRNSVVTYNQTLRQFQLYKSNIIVGAFMPSLEDDIKPIIIK